MYRNLAQSVIVNNLSHTQLAYRQAGNCTNALHAIQHQTYKYLDSSDCSAVRIFTMDFSKAFDFVNHVILPARLNQLPLNPYIINWYHSFLFARQHCVVSYNFLGHWKSANTGTTQFSVIGPYLFNIFLTDLEIFFKIALLSRRTYVHNLRKKGCARPKMNLERFMNTFVNFNLHLL